jgi:muconolactone delta-isomerase
MSSFIVMARFLPDTDMQDVYAVAKEEKAQVVALREQGRLGSVHISGPRQTVFIETFADDEGAALETVGTLPMARWWDLDCFPVTMPTIPDAAL